MFSTQDFICLETIFKAHTKYDVKLLSFVVTTVICLCKLDKRNLIHPKYLSVYSHC